MVERFVLFVLFVWLNRMNQTNQKHRIIEKAADGRE